MEIKGCSAIVTGGASGMGAQTAKMLSQYGAKVALLDMNLDALKKMADEIKGLAIVCDVTKEESVVNAINEANQHFGPARICINCAGIVHSRRMVNKEGPMPLKEFQHVIEVNLIGTF